MGWASGIILSSSSVVESVTGLNTDNADPKNPIVKISTDSNLLGAGTPASPLAVNSSLFQSTLVSGSNIKTINGNTLLGSGDLVISTGLTIGTTAITSGTAGRILFEGTGNVVQESANLFWDNTNSRLSVGTSTQAYTLAVGGKLRVSAFSYWVDSGANALQVDGVSSFSDVIILASGKTLQFGSSATQIGGTSAGLTFRAGSGNNQMSLFSTGNLLIQTGGTHTDAGFKLDVNGTARVQGALTVNTGTNTTTFSTNIGNILIYAGGTEVFKIQDSSSRNYIQCNTGANRVILSNGCMESTQNSVSRTSFNTNVTQDGTVQVLLSQQNTSGYHNDGFLITKGYFSSSGTQTYNNIFRITNNYISSPTTIGGTGSVVGINLDLSQTNGTSTISSRIIALRNGIGDVTLNVNSGNTMIGTETDAGFKLDVNGTARVSGQITGQAQFTNSTPVSTNAILLNGISTTDANTRILVNLGTLSSTGATYGARGIQGAVQNFGCGIFMVSNTANAIGYLANADSGTASVNGFTVRTNGQGVGGSIGFTWQAGNSTFFNHSVYNDGTFANLKLFNRTGDIYYVRDRDTTNITFGSSVYQASAQVAVDSTTKGFLPPRMTTAQKTAITSPAVGLVVYDTTLNKLCVYTTAWETITSV